MFFHQLRCDECMWKSKTHTHSTSAARKVKKTDEQNQLNRGDGGRKKFRNHSKIERTRLAAFGFGAHIRSSKDRQTLFQYCDTEKASFAVFFANHSALSHISFTEYGIDVAAGFFFAFLLAEMCECNILVYIPIAGCILLHPVYQLWSKKKIITSQYGMCVCKRGNNWFSTNRSGRKPSWYTITALAFKNSQGSSGIVAKIREIIWIPYSCSPISFHFLFIKIEVGQETSSIQTNAAG